MLLAPSWLAVVPQQVLADKCSGPQKLDSRIS
jgi:hypothetical protein